ncbi:hypothetical protein quinque_004047 [Culex quinquefasciatus]
MTRRPSQEKEAITYGRLPEIARHLRNVFVTERKSVLPLEAALAKIENSYRGKLTLRDLEEHLKIMAQLVPFWLTLTEVRKTMYAKISKDCDLGKVVTLLEKKANETLRSAPDGLAPGAAGEPGADGIVGGPRTPQQIAAQKRLQQTQAQVDEVVDIMKTNVEKVLERDQKLSELDDRADALQQGASQFEQQAGKLKRKFWLQNLKVSTL